MYTVLYFFFLWAVEKTVCVAGAAGDDFDGNGMAGYATDRFDYFSHGKTRAIAKIVDEWPLGCERIESEKMGLGEVLDVDVIADAGTVGSRIIIAVDFDFVAAA